MGAFWKRSLSAYTTVSFVSVLMTWQREYFSGVASAVPTSTPCSEERAGTDCQDGVFGAALTAAPSSAFCGSGRSKALASRGRSSGVCGATARPSAGAVGPAASSAGLGAKVEAATVLTVSAQSQAAINAATSVAAQEYLCTTNSMGGPGASPMPRASISAAPREHSPGPPVGVSGRPERGLRRVGTSWQRAPPDSDKLSGARARLRPRRRPSIAIRRCQRPSRRTRSLFRFELAVDRARRDAEELRREVLVALGVPQRL